MKKLILPLGLLAVLASGPALAGNDAPDLAAPYVHLAPASPYTTHFIITNDWPNTTAVNIKCYNSSAQRVGPAAGTSYTAGSHGFNVFSPVTLGLTSSVNFGDGIGWCYFAASKAVAVTYLMGAADNGNLIPTNNARGISADTAQHEVGQYPNLPYWTQEAGWKSFLLALYPRALDNLGFEMSVYNASGALQGTFSYPPFVTTYARDIDAYNIPESVGTGATFGSANINVNGLAFMGWVIGYNTVSNESFQYAVPLHYLATSELVVADRP